MQLSKRNTLGGVRVPVTYIVAVAAVALSGVVRWQLDPLLEDHLPFATFFVAIVVVAWYGGLRAALLATVLGFLLALYFFVPPRFSFLVNSGPDLVGLMVYFVVGVFIAGFADAMYSAKHRFAEQAERLRTTLASIGDGVITTDVHGRVANMNTVAESLTGWTNTEAMGQPLEEVFQIANERSRNSVENPATRALKDGIIVGLASQTILIAKGGAESFIDDSAAPIFSKDGKIIGCVLVFRDISQRMQAEKSLRDSESRKTAMFEAALDCIISIDKGGTIIEFNGAAERTFGFPRSEAIGKELAELLIPLAYRERHRNGLAQYLNTQQGSVFNQRLELSALRANGEEFPVELTVTPIPVDGPAQFTAYLRDITQRKQFEKALRESEERFRALADNIPQLAWIADAGTDGQVHWFNRNWFEYTGTNLEDMKGRGWIAVHHPDHVERVVQKFAHHVKEGLDWEDTFPLRGKDGQYVWFLSRMKVIRDKSGRVVRIFGTNTDITETRRTAEELRKLTAELSEADRRKDEFLATLAHELRNPLAPIRNGLQVLGLAGDSKSVSQQILTMMERQLKQMVRLVDDLMDVSRISTGKVELRKEIVSLASIVNNAVETSNPLIEQMRHKLTIQVPESTILVNVDAIRLSQVIMNLLNNAAKYSEPGGHIQLTSERIGGDVVVSVRDTGIGITTDQIPHLFDMFSQVDHSMEKSQGGLGIGLCLAKRIVEMHGGTIDARSDGLGKGAEFVVRLPVVVENAATQLKPEVQAQDMKSSLRILIVDDNKDGAGTLSMMLKILGNDTRTAYDGEDAVKAAIEFQPDVILLDIGLPKLNGFEVCRRIRQQKNGHKILVIAQTGWGQDEDRKRSRDAGFDHHLIKPVDMAALNKILAEFQTLKS